MYIGQVMQSLSDDYTIDFEKYKWKLANSYWITDTLHLTGKNETTEYQNISISLAGTCPETPKRIIEHKNQQWCWIEMQATPRNGWNSSNNMQTVALTNTGKILFTPVKFKIIPYAEPEKYYNWDTTCEGVNPWESIAKCIGSNGFRMLTTAYIPYYRDDKWVNKVKVVVQNFFNN